MRIVMTITVGNTVLKRELETSIGSESSAYDHDDLVNILDDRLGDYRQDLVDYLERIK